MATEEWELLCVVRGYHAYKDVWDSVLEDQFKTKHQKQNSHDKYTMAVVQWVLDYPNSSVPVSKRPINLIVLHNCGHD